MHIISRIVANQHALRLAAALETVDKALASTDPATDPAPILQAIGLLHSLKAYDVDKFVLDGDVISEVLAMRESQLADEARADELGKLRPAVLAEIQAQQNGHVDARGKARRAMSDLENQETGLAARRNGRLLRFKELEKFSRAMRVLRLMGLGTRGEPLAVAAKK